MNIVKVKCIYHLRSTQLPWVDPEDIPFTVTVRNEFARGASASLKDSDHSSLQARTRVRMAATDSRNLNTVSVIDSNIMCIIESQSGRGYVATLSH